MRWFHIRSAVIRTLGVAAVAMMTLPAVAQQPKPEADKAKGEVIEKAIKKAVADGAAPVGQPIPNPQAQVPNRAEADVTKSLRIEPGARQVVGQGTNIPAVPKAPATPEENPAAEAGSVKWHKDFATACASSAKSGKPVFLFQLMGHLDKQFC